MTRAKDPYRSDIIILCNRSTWLKYYFSFARVVKTIWRTPPFWHTRYNDIIVIQLSKFLINRFLSGCLEREAKHRVKECGWEVPLYLLS